MRIKLKSATILGLLAGSTAIVLSAPALAAEAAPGEGLDEIVVTAQKREQNLQVVPLAVSAINAEKVEKLRINDSRDLSGLAPNVTIVQGTTSNSSAVISMRGISNGGAETFGLDMASGIYVDGIYIARSGASGLEVADIERVEVLRGPQGTLFGRNTTGGAISFISRAPSKDLRIKGEGGFGNYKSWNGKISVDPGEILGISTSFSYSHRQRNGTVDNILQADPARDPGSRKSDSFRGAMRFDLGGTGSVQYIFDYTKTAGSPNAFQLTNAADGSVRSLTVDGQALVVTQQAPVQQYLARATFANAGCAALAAPTRVYRQQICNDISGYATDKTWGHNLQVQNDFGAFKLKSTTGYRFWNSDSVADLDGLGAITGSGFTNATLFNGLPAALLGYLPTSVIPAGYAAYFAAQPVPKVTQNLFDTSNQRRHKQFSQEVEISGDSDKLDWVVGGFYFWEKGSENNPQNSGFAYDTSGIFISKFGALGPMFAAANPAQYRLYQNLSTLKYTAKSESTALYGQFTLYPGGHDSGMRITAGGRYTWDNKNIFRTQNGATAYATPQTGDAKFSKFTWNLMLGYDLADGVTSYARVATGYRSGGFNAGDAADAGTNTIPSFDSESVTSYEAGLKTEMLDRHLRLNLAGYYNVYKNLAVVIPIPNATAGTFTTHVGNAGKVDYTGFEAEFQAVLSRNFSIDGSVGYVDVKYKQFCTGQPTSATAAGSAGCPTSVINIASIVTPGYTSPWTANIAANASFPIGENGTKLTARVAYTYEDGKYSFNNNIGAPYNAQLKGDNRKLVDAQIAVEGIEVGAAKFDMRLWGKNLTNRHDLVRGVDFGALGYAGATFADPRTYGMTIGFKY
ncbi:MAG: hypothetical protein RLZZ427_1094 [Pseudomonadota bacterium]